jgi:uncharacterized protein (TIGR03086 family)
MTSTLDRYDVARGEFERRLVALAPGDLERSTPCEGWDVAEVADHAVGVVALVAGLVPPVLPDDTGLARAERFAIAADDLRAKVADPLAGGTTVASPFGEMALKQLVSSVVVHDLLVHAWDLARATGADEQLDAALVAHTYDAMLPFDAFLREHGFAARVEAPAGADAQTELLCFLGRRP